ncbi:MAG: phosphoribosylanthranilate isomerase [Lachnospiraceae bacterium]|nr:phosphoribosylanthranilate isomerase [Lachnospiraceae bacterium]
MIRIKLCGLTKKSDILTADELLPGYIGFVLWNKSRRYVPPEAVLQLKGLLDPRITAVGVFVDEDIKKVSRLLKEGVIDAAQLHGAEGEDYIRSLKGDTGKPVIKAFRMDEKSDVSMINESPADLILLDSGAGGGRLLDRRLLSGVKRPYLLAGGLSPDNVKDAISELSPFGVDVSSGIETDGVKDRDKMRRFVEEVRRCEKHD